MEVKTAWMRRGIFRTAWVLAAAAAWSWRSDCVFVIEQFADASLPARLSIYSVVYVLLAGLAVPGAVLLTALAGPFFGTLLGTVAASFVSTLGASLAFLYSRVVFSQSTAQRDSTHREGFRFGSDQLGGWELLMLRLLPVVPFFAVNLLAGRSRLSLAKFWIVSQIGMLPATYLLVRLGASLPQEESLSRAEVLSATWPLLLVGTLVCGGRWLTTRQRRKQGAPAQTAKPPRSVSPIAAKSSFLIVAAVTLLPGCTATTTSRASNSTTIGVVMFLRTPSACTNSLSSGASTSSGSITSDTGSSTPT